MPAAQSVNDDLFDASVRHKVYLTRFENSVVKKILALLSKVDADLVLQIQKLDPNGVEGAWSRRRLEALLRAVREISADAYRQVNGQLKTDLSGLAKYEAGFQSRLLANTIPVVMDIVTPPAGMLVSAVTKDPIAGRLLKEWTDQLSANEYSRVSQAIRLGIIEGQTTPQIIQRVRGTRALKYKDGVLETSKRSAEALVRTAVSAVADDTRKKVLKENADILKAEKWVATLDTRTCVRCAALDGKEFPVGKGPSIPLHVNCFPADTLVSAGDGVTSASKHWYNGELCVIRTASGKEISCTPNHPILTDCGFLPASLVGVGGNVISDLGHVGQSLAVDVDNKNVPARIEDVAEAFLRSGKVFAAPVPVTAKDFHGDGVDGDIAIVASDSLLADGIEPSVLKAFSKLPLVVRNMCLAALSRRGSFAAVLFRLLLAANGVMRGLSKRASLLWARASHSGGLLFGSVARFNARHSQMPVYCGSHAAEMLGYAKDADASIEHLDNLFNWQRYFGSEGRGTNFDPALPQYAEDYAGIDAVLSSDIVAGVSGPVVVDNVISIERRDFSGHVYNLETKIGAYIADGIWVHNCRCTRAGVVKSFRDLGIDLDEAAPGTRASMNGQVPASMTYEEWLRKQSAEMQDDVLGVSKGKLFRAGKLRLEKFVNNGKELTLDELKLKESAAFKRAGLDN